MKRVIEAYVCYRCRKEWPTEAQGLRCLWSHDNVHGTPPRNEDR